MPSGMLCNVTANSSRVVRRQEAGRPSGLGASKCRWGSSWSSTRRKAAPRITPPAPTIHPGEPFCSASSMAGMSSPHTEAATITPAAKPRNTRWKLSLTDLRKKNTRDAPSVVIKKVKPVPAAAQRTCCAKGLTPFPLFLCAAEPYSYSMPQDRGRCQGWLPPRGRKIPLHYVRRDFRAPCPPARRAR